MIKKWVINQNDSADIRGIDENGKEICWLDSNHSFEVLIKTAEFSEAMGAPYSVQILKPKPVIFPSTPPKNPVPTGASWNDFIAAVAAYPSFEFPWMRELIIAQSIIESGRGTTELSKYKNFNGMKFRSELAQYGGIKFQYFTSSEPFRDATGKEVSANFPGAKQWDWFFSFNNYADAITTWCHFWNRSPYPKVQAKDPEVLKDLESFLSYIGPIYCPYFTNSHNESYASYIINRCLPEAVKKLSEVSDTKPAQGSNKIKGKGILLNNGHPRHGAGATSQNGKVDEYELNLFQCKRIKETLDKVDIPCKIINQTEFTGLHETGMQAEGYDCFLALHHNATVGAQYACVMLGSAPKTGSKEFGKILSARISKVLNIKDGGFVDYVVAITRAADSTNCPIVCLVESYFIDGITDMETAYDMSGRAADAISSALIERFK